MKRAVHRFQSQKNTLPAIAAMSVWRDLSAGAGPPIAGLLLPLAPLALYAGSGALLAAVPLVLTLLNVANWRPAC